MPHSHQGLARRVPHWGGDDAFDENTVASLAHWVKADDLTALYQDSSKTTPVASDGDPVGAWVDQVADEYTQATTTAKPTWRESVAALNNQPALDFDGGDWLQGAFASPTTQPTTIFVVAKADSVGVAVQYVFDGDDGTNRNLFQFNSTPEYFIHAGATLSGGTPNTNAHIYTIIFNSVSSAFFADGTSILSGDAGSNILDGLTIGAKNSLSQEWPGEIAELLIYTADLTANEKNLVQNYLASKYGISVTEFS